MFENASDLWLSVGVVLIVIAVLVRWGIAKYKGVEVEEVKVFAELRIKLVSWFAGNIALRELEKTQGRKAVRAYILEEIKTVILKSEMFTPDEKSLLVSLDLGYLVSVVENELVKGGILKGE